MVKQILEHWSTMLIKIGTFVIERILLAQKKKAPSGASLITNHNLMK